MRYIEPSAFFPHKIDEYSSNEVDQQKDKLIHETGTWKAAKIWIALFGRPARKDGYEYRGLGLHLLMKGMPEYQVPPTWSIHHLGSGHLICTLRADDCGAFRIAAEIAELGDWTFDGLTGWKNMFPEAPQLLEQLRQRYLAILQSGNGLENEPLALRILQKREENLPRNRKNKKRKATPKPPR